MKSGSQGAGIGTDEGKVQPDVKAKGQKRAWLQVHSDPNPQCRQHTKRILFRG